MCSPQQAQVRLPVHLNTTVLRMFASETAQRGLALPSYTHATRLLTGHGTAVSLVGPLVLPDFENSSANPLSAFQIWF